MVNPPFPESLDYFFPPACAGGATDFFEATLAFTGGAGGFFAVPLTGTACGAVFAAAPPAVAVGATGFAAALTGVAGVAAPAPAAGVAALGRKVTTVWHCGQRTFNTVLPRSTASGIRIAAWHLLQITRIESVGAGTTASFAAAT